MRAIPLLVFTLFATCLTGQTWMKGYEQMLIQDSCQHTPFYIHPIEETNDYILVVDDSIYRIDQGGNVDLRYRAIKEFDEKLIRHYNQQYFTASRTQRTDEYIICKYNEKGVFIDSFSITGQQTNIGGFEIENDRIIIFSINEWISSLDYYDLNGGHILGRWFEQNWTHPGVPGINMQKDSAQFYINVYHIPWRGPDTISVINMFMNISKAARYKDFSVYGTTFNALYFSNFNIGSNNNVYIPLREQGIAKLKYGRILTMARSLSGYQLNDTGRIYQGYTYVFGANRDVIGLLDAPSFLDKNGSYLYDRSLLFHCLDESLEVYNSVYIPFEKSDPEYHGWYVNLEVVDGNTMIPNELGGFTILLKNARYRSDSDCYDAFPVLIKTDSTCQIPMYRVHEESDGSIRKYPGPRAKHFRLYPNPTPGRFRVEIAEQIINIQVHDLTGKLIAQSVEPEIDISDQPAGVYMVNIRTKNQTYVEKIVKQ